MDMYREMQEELSQKGEKKDSGKVKKAPKPKAVTKREETDKIYCPECGEPLVFEEGCNMPEKERRARKWEKNYSTIFPARYLICCLM